VVASVSLALLVIEILFRIFWKAPSPRMVVMDGRSRVWCCGPETVIDGVERFVPGATFKHCYGNDPSGSMEPDACVTYRINSLGYRDVDHPIDKPDDVFRIVILGDSFTVGEGTAFDRIYPALLARELQGHTIDGKGIEVVSLGFPGNDTSLEQKSYLFLGRKLRPDWVVTQWTTNDFPASATARKEVFEVGRSYIELMGAAQHPGPSRAYHHFWLRRQLGEVSKRSIAATLRDLQKGSPNLQQIRSLRRAVKEDGARFTLLIFPEMIQLDHYPYADVASALEAFCRREGIERVDLLPALSKHRDRELWVHEIDHHPNGLAHRIAFEQLLSVIRPALDR
jgi:lysophospholipase L1-like esterase